MAVFYATELQTSLYTDDDEWCITIIVRGDGVHTVYAERVEDWAQFPYTASNFEQSFQDEVTAAIAGGQLYISKGYELETD